MTTWAADPRRQQQRVGRVRHVEGATCQGFGAGPSQPVPEKVQQPDRHPPIDGRQAVQIRVVEPRRSRHELEKMVRSSVFVLRQRLDELVRIFADAGPLAQGRPVIDQDAHLFKSFRLSILL